MRSILGLSTRNHRLAHGFDRAVQCNRAATREADVPYARGIDARIGGQ